ncbi:MAG: transcription antitermination factor NusB [Bacteroidota bacterium]
MLTRRYIRIKVMQAIYAFFFSDSSDLKSGEQNLIESNRRVYELYIWLLSIYVELKEIAEQVNEDNKNKMLPSQEDLNPNTRFVENSIIKSIENNAEYKALYSKYKINWSNNIDVLRKAYTQLKTSEYFQNYMTKKTTTFEEDKELLLFIIQSFIESNEILQNVFEESYIHWAEDFYYACGNLEKTINTASETHGISVLPMYKDADEDLDFLKVLFKKSIMNKAEHEQLIASHADNWEFERIAGMDLILMNMAVTETLEFQAIPIKVTLNEYIELSKLYSSPKSKIFINGVLDKIISQLKQEGKILKTGRGLID